MFRTMDPRAVAFGAAVMFAIAGLLFFDKNWDKRPLASALGVVVFMVLGAVLLVIANGAHRLRTRGDRVGVRVIGVEARDNDDEGLRFRTFRFDAVATAPHEGLRLRSGWVRVSVDVEAVCERIVAGETAQLAALDRMASLVALVDPRNPRHSILDVSAIEALVERDGPAAVLARAKASRRGAP